MCLPLLIAPRTKKIRVEKGGDIDYIHGAGADAANKCLCAVKSLRQPQPQLRVCSQYVKNRILKLSCETKVRPSKALRTWSWGWGSHVISTCVEQALQQTLEQTI